MPFLAASVITSSLFTPQASISASQSFFPGGINPDSKLVAYMTKEHLLNTARSSDEAEKEPKKLYTQAPYQPQPIILASYPSSSSYDDIYKSAGEKYGIPWQILYGIHMTETGCRNGPIMNHTGTGAQGPMQFMPGTWRAYGVDGDGDGIADINNAVDAIHGAANYLAKHGSLDTSLRSYGGNYSGTLAYARAKGYEN